MTNSPHRSPHPRAALLRAMLGIWALSLLTCVFANTSHAQVFVTDKLSIAGNKASSAAQLAKTVDQYTKQIEQYQTQLNQYEQILTSVQGLATGGITLTSGRLTPINDASNLIQQTCPGANGGGILGDMTSIVTSSFSQSITANQQNICAQIVLAQVHKYNATVKVVNDTQQFGQELQQITKGLGSMTTQGDSDRVAANAGAHSDQISSEMVDWQGQMAKDDAVIATLQQQQGILAKVALNGSNTILGNVVQAGAFAAAFH